MRWDAPRREYAGNCIDGPCRGQKRTYPVPYFSVNHTPPIHLLDFSPNDYVSGAITYDVVTYRWSFSLGEWCMVY